MRLEFEDVSYSYEGGEAKKKKRSGAKKAQWGNAPDAPWALRHVSFTVEPGEFWASPAILARVNPPSSST